MEFLSFVFVIAGGLLAGGTLVEIIYKGASNMESRDFWFGFGIGIPLIILAMFF